MTVVMGSMSSTSSSIGCINGGVSTGTSCICCIDAMDTSMNKCLMVMVVTGEVVCLHINKVVSGCFSLQFSVFFMNTCWIIAF